ncbi:hemopexin repeat-containing protein [Streptomyces mobaraensis]|uniref:Hemopexin n=1 Tax=Streptomyces mobaraensis TaxID=35621 RepID=A0A5N5W0V4_STRMB|nr:hemopexin repeat-containing protein [Streptomyces mobaraensis]KAB7835343.1 hypothetical protein FRZ00_27345 [Streptomyces mobaraensis]
MGAKVYFIKGGNYARYELDPDPGTVEYVKSIATNWGGMAARGFASGLDAAINDDAGEYVSFYKGGNYVRYGTAQNDIVDLVGEPPYPWPITNGWASFLTGTGFEDYLDGGFGVGDGSAWFFRDNRCLRGSPPAGIIQGPDTISSLAPSLASAGFGSDIDDGVRLPDGRTYLFKGDKYVRLDPLTLAVDAGYPVTISDGWMGFSSAFGANDFDAVWINPNHP